MHPLLAPCKQARCSSAHPAPRRASGVGSGRARAHSLTRRDSARGSRGAGQLSIPRCRPCRRCPSPAPAHRSGEGLRSGHRRARFGVGKQNHSSERAAERGQRKPPADEQHGGAPGASCPRRQPRGEGVPGPQRGARVPLKPPLHRAPEPAAGTSQLPPPPELLQQGVTDPSLA